MANYSGIDDKLGHLVPNIEEEVIDSFEELTTVADDNVLEMKIKSGDRARFTPAKAEASARQASNRYRNFSIEAADSAFCFILFCKLKQKKSNIDVAAVFG